MSGGERELQNVVCVSVCSPPPFIASHGRFGEGICWNPPWNDPPWHWCRFHLKARRQMAHPRVGRPPGAAAPGWCLSPTAFGWRVDGWAWTLGLQWVLLDSALKAHFLFSSLCFALGQIGFVNSWLLCFTFGPWYVYFLDHPTKQVDTPKLWNLLVYKSYF